MFSFLRTFLQSPLWRIHLQKDYKKRFLCTYSTTQKPPIKIFFGSQTGTAMGFAQELADEAQKHHFEAQVVDMNEYDTVSLISEFQLDQILSRQSLKSNRNL